MSLIWFVILAQWKLIKNYLFIIKVSFPWQRLDDTQTKLTLSPYFFQYSARKISLKRKREREGGKEKEREHFIQIKVSWIPSLIFYRDHIFFTQFIVNVMAKHSEPLLVRIWCLKVVIFNAGHVYLKHLIIKKLHIFSHICEK